MRQTGRSVLLVLAASGALFAQPLPGTSELRIDGDPAVQMIAGMEKYLLALTGSSRGARAPSAEKLRTILGVVDQREAFQELQFVADTARPALAARTPAYSVFRVRWPVLEQVTAEGLYFKPERAARCRMVVLPDADQLPEDSAPAQEYASAGCEVLVPVLIDRRDTWSGNPDAWLTNLPHREWIYRMAFQVGRHILGYEIQKVLAAVDWFGSRPQALPVAVYGYGEGGLIALYAAAIDTRIQAAMVSGAFREREGVWKEPLYHNVFGLLKDFGDAEAASLIAPRTLLIEASDGPVVTGPLPPRSSRNQGAAGTLDPVPQEVVKREMERARRLKPGTWIRPAAGADALIEVLGIPRGRALPVSIAPADADGRQRRQVAELVRFTQELVRGSELRRERLWLKVKGETPEQWRKAAEPLAARFQNEVMGKLPGEPSPLHVRTRKSYDSAHWTGYETQFDVRPEVFGYGVLLLPKNIPAGERRPLIVVQHGLNSRPQVYFQRASGRELEVYRNFGEKLADLGYVVYLPQNPYIGEFRQLVRMANPLGLTLYSLINAQYEQMLDWLVTLPEVDAGRIGYYGLSYGGKTALRFPNFDRRFKAVICAGDFNEWNWKMTSVHAPFSYMFNHEFELLEWNMASVAGHAELALLTAPRAFMVERGHRDQVSIDEWVSYEYAKVRRFYDEFGIGDRTHIEFFNGPHRVDGPAAIEFLKKHVGTPTAR